MITKLWYVLTGMPFLFVEYNGKENKLIENVTTEQLKEFVQEFIDNNKQAVWEEGIMFKDGEILKSFICTDGSTSIPSRTVKAEFFSDKQQ